MLSKKMYSQPDVVKLEAPDNIVLSEYLTSQGGDEYLIKEESVEYIIEEELKIEFDHDLEIENPEDSLNYGNFEEKYKIENKNNIDLGTFMPCEQLITDKMETGNRRLHLRTLEDNEESCAENKVGNEEDSKNNISASPAGSKFMVIDFWDEVVEDEENMNDVKYKTENNDFDACQLHTIKDIVEEDEDLHQNLEEEIYEVESDDSSPQTNTNSIEILSEDSDAEITELTTTSDIKLVNCAQCSYKTITNWNLKQHISRWHGKKRTWFRHEFPEQK